jgi:ribonuclease J
MQAKPLLVEDGDVLRLAPGRADVVDGVPTGRLVVDEGRLLPLSGGVLAARKRMLFNGVVMASLAVDAAGRVMGEAQVSAPGLFETADIEPARIAADLTRAVEGLPSALRREDDALREAARAALRKAVGRRLRKRPAVEVHLLRV